MSKIILMLVFLISYNCFAEETRDKIVVIDSGVGISQFNKHFMCKNGSITTFPNSTIFDNDGHGTNIIGLIASKINSKTQCIVSIKTWDVEANMDAYLNALEITRNLKPKFVNISMTGEGFNFKELMGLISITNNGGTIIVAAGNEGINLDNDCKIYPACYKKIISRFNKNKFYVISTLTTGSGNSGSIVSAYLDGKNKGFPVRSGTSQATAIFTSLKISN